MQRIFYVMPNWQNDPLYMVKIEDKLIRAFEKHLKHPAVNCTLSAAPPFEFNDDTVNLDKRTITSKQDF